MPPTLSYGQETSELNTSKIIENQTNPRGEFSDEISTFDAWFNEAQELRRQHDDRWTKNIRLLRGIFPPEELSRSKVRKRSKIFFRKIWASNWRILASMHDAFLREADQFRVVGRNGDDGDEDKAEILQTMTEYRRDLMMRKESLFLQLIWNIMSILDLGWTCAKFGWKYKKDKDGKVIKDQPDFVSYPNEQVYPDLRADLPHKMRFIFFENYLTAEDMAEEGYDTTGCAMYGPSNNVVRNARIQDRQQDPMQYSDSNTNQTYPRPGGTGETRTQKLRGVYCVREVIYRSNHKLKMAVYCGQKMLVKPMDSPYGERYPIVMGQCLTLANQLIGEGFPEPQEGPQESLNVTLNQRKDNISILMNGESVVDRYANVDLEALRTSRPANVILSDNPDAVRPLQKNEVTQSAYIEAGADMAMMDETSGVTPGLMGLDKSQKATTSQLNFSNSGAKMSLFISLVAQTFFRDFFTQLAYMIQKFETDETIFKVANRTLNRKRLEDGKPQLDEPIDTIDDFVADIDVQVQPDMMTREQQARNIMLAMDRAIMSNQALIPLVQAGIVPASGVELHNIAEYTKILLPLVGQRNTQKFLLKIQKQDLPPPGVPGKEGGGTGTPETPEDTSGIMNAMQDLQGGSNATGPFG